MSKWHVNPQTGNPGRCKADPSNPRGRGCDFQLAESEHFNSALSAARHYEDQQSVVGLDQFSTVSAVEVLPTVESENSIPGQFSQEVLDNSFWGRNSTRVGGGLAATLVISSVASLWGNDQQKPWWADNLASSQAPQEIAFESQGEPVDSPEGYDRASDMPNRSTEESRRLKLEAFRRNAELRKRKADRFTNDLLDGDLSRSGFSVSRTDYDAISAGGFFGGKGFQEHVPRQVSEGVQFQGKPLRPSNIELDEAAAKLDSLRVTAPNVDYYYDRATQFGRAFESGVVAEIERRDITHAKFDNDSPNARAHGGYFVDPYTGERVYVVRGSNDDTNVEHIVPLHEVMQSQDPDNPLSHDERIAVANDPENLQIVGAAINRIKSDRDPGVWMPPNKASHMRYAIATINVKSKYNLSLDPTEYSALHSILEARSYQYV